MRDLIGAALIQSANDAADRSPSSSATAGRTVRRDDERQGARARDHRHPLRTRTGWTLRPLLQRGRRDEARAGGDEQAVIRGTVRLVDATAGGRKLRNWNDFSATYPGLFGVKTGHTDLAGWSQVAAARRAVSRLRDLLGCATRSGETPTSRRCSSGDFRATGPSGRRRRRSTAGAPGYGRIRSASSPRSLRCARPCRAAAVEHVVMPVEVALPVRQGQRLGEVQVLATAR